MKVVVGRPPNFEKIVAAFPLAARLPGVIFAYGDTIFNPGGRPIPPSLIVHENTHSVQQRGAPPDLWWDLYIANQKFRFEQELEAHRAEWKHYETSGAGRNARRTYLSLAAHRLASPLYGKMVSASEAKRAIAA